MSRIGVLPVPVPSGITVEIAPGRIQASKGNEKLSVAVPPVLSVEHKDGQVRVSRAAETAQARAHHGTVRSLIENMFEGLDKGFRRELEIQGVGFRAQVQGQKLTMNIGFSHPIEYTIPDGVTVTAPDATHLVVTGTDKQQVGLVAARIREYYPAEPYKGKGIRYQGEQVRRKAGKAVS